jgi:copper chaperone NosL
MGSEEVVPFSERAAAEKFASKNGGRIVSFVEVPREYVLGSGAQTNTAGPEPTD